MVAACRAPFGKHVASHSDAYLQWLPHVGHPLESMRKAIHVNHSTRLYVISANHSPIVKNEVFTKRHIILSTCQFFKSVAQQYNVPEPLVEIALARQP